MKNPRVELLEAYEDLLSEVKKAVSEGRLLGVRAENQPEFQKDSFLSRSAAGPTVVRYVIEVASK